MTPKKERTARALFSAIALLALLALLIAACVPIRDPSNPSAPSAYVWVIPLTPVAATAVEAAPVITHSVIKRPECLHCHEAETGRSPSPADHRGMTVAVCLYCHESEDGEVATPPLPAVADPEFCLGCHGPFDELAARTEAMFVVKGVEANPHMYVPHDSTKPFNCKNCHEVHDLPVTDAVLIPQADIGYCYIACHHEEDFTPCTECHTEDDDE